MEDAVLRLKDVFRGLVPSFGLNHSKIYLALISGEVRTAKDLAFKSGVPQNKVYEVLGDLGEYGLVCSTNTHPVSYSVKDPKKIVLKLVNSKVNFLAKKTKELEKILTDSECVEWEKTYLITIKGKQTKIVDFKNKSIVKDESEIKDVKKQIDLILEDLNKSKKYKYALYR